jgi:fibronectin type 3 domain-containing protein
VARRPRATLALLALATTVACTGAWQGLDALRWPRASELEFERDVDLIPPEGLRVTSTRDRQVALAWDPVLVGDVAGYAVMRGRDKRVEHDLIGRTRSRFQTVFVDRGESPGSLGDGETYFYRVHPFDSEGRVASAHRSVSATTDPPPAPPQGLTPYSNLPRRVVLAWDASDDPGVHGYALLRAPTTAGPWERRAMISGRLTTVYEDDVPGDLRVMYYRLTARNRFDGESAMSDPVRAVTKAEPLPPIGLEVRARRLGEIDLAWEPNVEADVKAYDVLRAGRSGPREWSRERRAGRVVAAGTALTDGDVGCGETVRYRLRARDADGLESALSSPIETTGADLALEVVRDGSGHALRWNREAARGWKRARVYRVRALRPDPLLGEAPAGERFALPDLGTGMHRLRVVLVRDRHDEAPRALPGRNSRLELSPPCELHVELPVAPAAPSP